MIRHLQRDYTSLGQVTAAGEGHAAANGAADRTMDEGGASEGGARVKAATNTASEPTGPPPGTAPPWAGDTWNTHAWRATPAAPATKRNKRRPETSAYGSPVLLQGGSSPWQSASDGCLLLTSRSRHLAEGTSTMADITFGHRMGNTPPATIDHPG